MDGSAAEFGRAVGAAFKLLAARGVKAVAAAAEAREDAAGWIYGGGGRAFVMMMMVVVVVMRIVPMFRVGFFMRVNSRWFAGSCCGRWSRGCCCCRRRSRAALFSTSVILLIFTMCENLIEVDVDHIDSRHRRHRVGDVRGSFKQWIDDFFAFSTSVMTMMMSSTRSYLVRGTSLIKRTTGGRLLIGAASEK